MSADRDEMVERIIENVQAEAPRCRECHSRPAHQGYRVCIRCLEAGPPKQQRIG